METDLTCHARTVPGSEMHCPSVLDPEMHLTPKGAFKCENETFDKSREWVLSTPTLQPTELGFSRTLGEETEDAAEIPSMKESIQKAQGYNTSLCNTEDNCHAEVTPRTLRVEVTTPLRVQDNAPNHSSKLSLSSDDCVLSTPPFTPSAQEHSEQEFGDAAFICALSGAAAEPTGDKQQDPVADLTEEINSEVSATTVETENASTYQRVFCPTAEELNFFRYFVLVYSRH
jgi:hypothetical protein